MGYSDQYPPGKPAVTECNSFTDSLHWWIFWRIWLTVLFYCGTWMFSSSLKDLAQCQPPWDLRTEGTNLLLELLPELGFEPVTSQSGVQCLHHLTTAPQNNKSLYLLVRLHLPHFLKWFVCLFVKSLQVSECFFAQYVLALLQFLSRFQNKNVI